MPIYEFKCAKRHVTSELVRIGTEEIICQKCMDQRTFANTHPDDPVPMAKRILSPTPTTFKFASK